jgi:hypothetical protein
MAKRKSRPVPQRQRRERQEVFADRANLLAQFDLMTEAQLAVLFGVTVKTLQNRPLAKLPSFSKVGNERLFSREAVKEYLARNNVSGSRRRYGAEPRPAGAA